MRAKNLLIIMSDQHSRSLLGCYGHPVVHTPNLDRLAACGTRFSSCWTPSPVCIPARASFAYSWTFPCGVNEMEAAGLEAAAPSLLIKPPRIKATPCALECKWLRTVRD